MRFRPSIFLALVFLLFWNMPALSAEKAGAVLEGITFHSDAESGENISFKLNGEYMPKIFTIEDANPRIVLDFPDVRCANAVNRAFDAKGKLVKKIRVGSHNEQPPKIRVVIDLAPHEKFQHTHHFDAQKNTLIVHVSPAGEGASHKDKGKKEAKETVPSAKVAEGKHPEKEAGKKADESAAPALKKDAEKKEVAAISPPKEPVPEAMRPEGQQAMMPKEPVPPEANKKEAEPSSAKKNEGKAKAPEKAVPAVPEPKSAMSPPLDKPATGKGSEEPMPEVMGKKPVVKDEKPEAKTESPAADKKDAATSKSVAAAGKGDKESPKVEAPAKKSAEKKSGPALINVTFENTSSKGEMVIFKLNGFYPPKIFGVEKGEPKVICDFPNAHLDENVKDLLRCNGKYVESVKVSKQTKPPAIRAVLHLVPSKSYDLQQVFFKEDNLFVIIVNSQDDVRAGKTDTQ